MVLVSGHPSCLSWAKPYKNKLAAVMAFEDTIISLRIRQFLAGLLTLAFLALLGVSPAHALGLGELKLRSFLGQSLQANLELVGAQSEFFNTSCVRARVQTFDGAFLASVHIGIEQRANKRQLLLTTRQHLNEPAVNLIIDMNCEVQLHREFSILLDPPDHGVQSNAYLEELAVVPALDATNTPAKQKMNEAALEAGEARLAPRKRVAPALLAVPESATLAVEPKKSKRKKVAPAKDVLRLSDDIDLPKLEQGLRMSEILSTPSGSDLLENMQELRAAQARMAAILRDEAEVKSSVTPALSELGEINRLKKEAEHLKKQNQIDKASLQQLQSKSAFDYWLLALSVVATLAILVIVFLLLYIRRNFGVAKPSWWEDEEEEALPPSPVRIEEVIDQLQAKFEINTGSDQGVGVVKAQAANANEGQVTSPQSAFAANSSHRTPTLEETNSSIFNFYSPRASSVKVEEISDVTQEAEFWISMNDPQRAIEILAAHERVEHPDSPVPWLFLLDLYRTVGEREKYEQLRQRFIGFFNANIPEYETELATLVFRHLDDFPHILDKICSLWGGAEALTYLESLLVDDRNGSRNGFDLPVYRDILMLIGIAHELERLRLAEAQFEPPANAVEDVQSIVDPVDEAEFGTIDFEMIEFPLTDPDAKKGS